MPDTTNMTVTIELRCPVGPKALLAKLRATGEKPTIAGGNLMELSCRDCTKNGRSFDTSVKRVLHRFDLFGELVESEVERY